MSSSRRLWLMHLSEKESSRASTLTISFYRHPCVPGPAACCFCLFPYYYGTGFMVRSLLFFFFFSRCPCGLGTFPKVLLCTTLGTVPHIFSSVGCWPCSITPEMASGNHCQAGCLPIVTFCSSCTVAWSESAADLPLTQCTRASPNSTEPYFNLTNVFLHFGALAQ